MFDSLHRHWVHISAVIITRLYKSYLKMVLNTRVNEQDCCSNPLSLYVHVM